MELIAWDAVWRPVFAPLRVTTHKSSEAHSKKDVYMLQLLWQDTTLVVMFAMSGRNGDSDSPMIFYSKAPAAAASCHSSSKSAICIPCNKLAVTCKEGTSIANTHCPFCVPWPKCSFFLFFYQVERMHMSMSMSIVDLYSA